MPFLDVEDFIAESIESVLSQTSPDWELLMIDDGSTDGSTEIALGYAKRDPRICYLEHEGHQNRGASASRNLGLKHARGRYIAMLDADDVWLPRKLEQQVELLERQPDIDLLYGRTEYWYSWSGTPEGRAKDRVRDLGLQLDRAYPPASLYAPLFLKLAAPTPCTCSIIIRGELIERTGGFVDQFRGMYDDQALYAKLFLVGRAYVASAMWDRYRQHPASLCGVARREGRGKAARLTFLEWLERYLAEQGAAGDILRQLRRELWRNRHPLAAHAMAAPMRLFHRGGSLLRNLAPRRYRTRAS